MVLPPAEKDLENKKSKKKTSADKPNEKKQEGSASAPKIAKDTGKSIKKETTPDANQSKVYQVKGTTQPETSAAQAKAPSKDAAKAKKGGESAQTEDEKDKFHKINIRQKRDNETGATDQATKRSDLKREVPSFVKKTGPTHTEDPLMGYTPPIRNQDTKKAKKDEDEKPGITYTLEFIFSFKADNKGRPDNMAELNFPHKKRGTNGFRKKLVTEKDIFNKTLGDMRILLNKLSLSNFEVISTKLLAFNYNPSLLHELMKMIFIKSTGEHSYLEVYVKLCSLLFKQFNDKENYEMNFKKLLVNKCQKQFFKMLNKEREERKKRRDSLNNAEGLEELEENEEFSKPMMYLMDDKELSERKRD